MPANKSSVMNSILSKPLGSDPTCDPLLDVATLRIQRLDGVRRMLRPYLLMKSIA